MTDTPTIDEAIEASNTLTRYAKNFGDKPYSTSLTLTTLAMSISAVLQVCAMDDWGDT